MLAGCLPLFEELDFDEALPTYMLFRTQLDGRGDDDFVVVGARCEQSLGDPFAPNGIVTPKTHV